MHTAGLTALPKLAITALVAAALMAPRGSPPAGEADAGPPAWLRDHMQFVTRDGGRWIADNSAYQSADEPFDAYLMEWTWGLGKASKRGRMFALREGEQVATVWELVTYWHPGDGKAHTLQMGADGTLAAGELRQVGEHELESIDVFHAPDGSQRTIRHQAWEEGDEWPMQTWDRNGETWVKGREYILVRQP